MKKNLLILLLAIAMIFALTGCGKKYDIQPMKGNDNFELTSKEDSSGEDIDELSGDVEAEVSGEEVNQEGEVDMSGETVEAKNPIVTMVIKDLGTIKMELYPEIAPETVKNFVSLVNSGFYDGLIFHRVIPNFMVQGGDPLGNGTGGAEYNIKGEFAINGVENNLSHVRGLVSMARSNDYDSASTQFFIVTTDSTYLDKQYAGFGRVIEGMDVADKIVNQPVVRREIDEGIDYYTNTEEYIKQSLECDRPVNPPVIEKATVETFGIEYGEPNKLK